MKHVLHSKKHVDFNDQGFSLVELIIVIAIMAVRVGTVGTQVIPYLNNAKKARDIQILSAYATAGVMAYSSKVDSVSTTLDDLAITITPGSGTIGDIFICNDAQAVADEMKFLVNKNYVTESDSAFRSKTYNGIDKIVVTFDFINKKVFVKAYKGADEVSVDDEIGALL